MRIGLDAYVTAPNQGGFISYITHLAESLAASDGDDVVLYVPSVSPVKFDLPNVATRVVPFEAERYGNRTERDVAWHQSVLLGALESDRPEVFLGTSFFLPLQWDGPMVVTVHDVIFERHPEYFMPANLELYRTWGRRAASAAKAVLTVSQTSAADVKRFWNVRDKPVVATPLGHSLAFIPDDLQASKRVVAEQLFGGRETEYVLSVAAGHRRKNLPGLLKANRLLPGRLRESHRLLLVNQEGDRTRALVAEHGLTDQTVITGRLPAELVPHVYAAARLLVHPSFYEGFGIPVLEAMACGTPVVSSTRPAIPEVAGDAALLVDPDDTSAIADAMATLMTDPALAESLSAAGRRRSRGFDWRRTAELTREVMARATGA